MQIFFQRYPEVARDRPPIELEYREDVAILTIRTFSFGLQDHLNGTDTEMDYVLDLIKEKK